MPNNNGVVSIGLTVDYEKVLKQMISDFNQALTKISNEAKRTGFEASVKDQIAEIRGEMSGMAEEFKQTFDEINSKKINTNTFEELQTKMTKGFDKMERKFTNVNDQIKELRKSIGMLDGSSFAENMRAQFDGLYKSLKDTYGGLQQILDLTKVSSGGAVDTGASETAKAYAETLEIVRKTRAEIDKIENSNGVGKKTDVKGTFSAAEERLKNQLDDYRRINNEIEKISKASPEYSQKEQELVRIQVAIKKTIRQMQLLSDVWEETSGDPLMNGSHNKMTHAAQGFDKNIDAFIAKAEKMSQATRKVEGSIAQVQGEFNTFKIKDGAIHVPIDIVSRKGDLKTQINDIIQDLKKYAEKKPIVAKVKLTLDGGSSGGYKKNSEAMKQVEAGQGEPAIDISKSIEKTYGQAVREAEKMAKDSIKAIQAVFDESPIKIKPDGESFKKKLADMVSSSLNKISKDTTGLDVNNQIEKLVENLEKASASLSGNEGLKFGLDEASIDRITASIRDMADMIQRAFGVASNEDIAAQWTAIESKFKGVAGEEGKLLKGNKEHKVAIQELAVEYKKYLDMGGKNDLSELTAHKQTVKNITAEYEKLNVGVKGTQDVLEQNGTEVALTPTGETFKADAEKILDAINLEKEVKLTVEGKSIVDIQDGLDKALTKAEIVQNAVNQIPQAEGTGRFIHWTSPESALQKLANPKGISMEGAGTLSQFTDALGEAESSSKMILECFESLHHIFGDNALVIDIPIDEIKAFNDITKTPDFIPRDYIKGMVNAVDGTVKLNNDQTTATSNGVKESVASNKALAKQAGQTAKKLEEEGNVAQTTSERFAELAEKKKAATDANLELGIAAEMTTKALQEEAKAQKEAKERKKTNKSAVAADTYESNAPAWQKNIKQSLLDSGNYLEVYEGKLSRLESGTVRYTAFVRDSAEEGAESWKKLTATISSTGEIESTKLQEITEKQFLKIEKEKKDAARMAERMAGEEVEPIRLSTSEIQQYTNETTEILKNLEELSKTTYQVKVTNNGQLLITREEIAETGAEAEKFTIKINRIDDVLEETADGVQVSSNKIQAALDGAFDSASLTNSTKDLASKAQDAFDKFFLKHEGDSNWKEIAADVEKVKQDIAGIDREGKLNKFKQDLANLAGTLRDAGKDNKLGKIIDTSKTFEDIEDVRTSISSLLASMGKVDEKSIRVKGVDKLTAEVKAANGEIRQITVNLDSKGFARFVDNGIVEFGRLRAAAEGVFKGIQSMVRIYLSPQDFIRYFRQGFDKVKEIDTAMTELRKVSDAPMEDIAAYFDDATVSAKELGSSVKDMIAATADWSRLGME